MKFEILAPGEGDYKRYKDFIINIDERFIPKISEKQDLENYINKTFEKAFKFCFIENDKIIACNIVYLNVAPGYSYGSIAGVLKEYESEGLGLFLMRKANKKAKEIGSAGYRVQIRSTNLVVYKFYLSQGFQIIKDENFKNTDIHILDLQKNFF